MANTPNYAPLLLVTLAQIVARWHLTDRELTLLMEALAFHERKLINGKKAYIVSDVEDVLGRIRAGA